MRNLRNSIFLAALILLGCVAAPSAHGQGSFPPTIYYNGATPLGPAVRYVCSTNLTCTLTNGALTVTASSTASTSWPSITGSATNTNTGFVLAPTVTTSVLWTYNAATGQSADIVDFDLNSVKEVWIDSTGVLHLAQTGAFSTTGSAASLSISGQTGLLTFTGLTSTNRAITVRDAADTMLELGGSYTPTGTWNWSTASVTWPTFNQSTTGNAATASALAATPTTCGAGVAATGVLANGNATGCFTPSGSGNTTSTSLTTNTLPKANGANSIINSSVSDNGTTVSTTEPINAQSFGSTADGTHPGYDSFAGNTTLPSLSANLAYILGPPAATFTAYSMQLPSALPTTGHLMYCAVTSANCLLTDTGYAYNAIPNADLANSAITIAGTAVSLGGSTSSFPSPGAIGGTTPAAGSFTTLTGTTINTTTKCAAAGSAANPSVVSCSAAAAGLFSCATNASTGTCVVDTTAVTATSVIQIEPDDSLGTALSVTCNTAMDTGLTAPRVSARSAGTSFTINLGTFTTNPECFSYVIIN